MIITVALRLSKIALGTITGAQISLGGDGRSMHKPSPDQLASFALFGGLDPSCCALLADRMSVEAIKNADVIYEEGDPAHELYVVVEGRLEVMKSTNPGLVGISPLGPGDFFGEMSFLDMQPRSATVRAVSDVKLWRMDYAALRDTYKTDMKCYTLVVMNIAREMSRRLRRADHTRLAIQQQVNKEAKPVQ